MSEIHWNSHNLQKLKKYKTDDHKLDYKFPIPWRKEIPTEFPIYKMPLSVLYYNFRNTRIRAELEGKFKKVIDRIDTTEEKNIDFVEQILLSSNWISDLDTEKLINDLRDRGQLDPVIATPDGVLIDGNRRLAIFHKIGIDHPDWEGFSEMKVCVLPDDATKDELKELEMRVQMFQTFRIGYGDINIALEFRSLHREFGWGFEKITKLTGKRYDEKLIDKMIKVIDIVDDYLKWVGEEKQYITVDRKWESFENLYRLLEWSKKQDISDPEIINNRKILGFKLIRFKASTYRYIRKYYRVLRNEESRKSLEKRSDTLRGHKLDNFSNHHVMEEVGNVFDAEDYLNTIKQDPTNVVEMALKKLQTIKVSHIEKGDESLKKALDRLLQKINSLREKI